MLLEAGWGLDWFINILAGGPDISLWSHTFVLNPKPVNSLLSSTKSANIVITNSSRLSTTELDMVKPDNEVPRFLKPVPIAGDRRAAEGAYGVGSDVTRMKLDPLRSLSDLGNVGLGGPSTVTVLTMGGARFDDKGRITTSPPSNVSAESFEFSSVSALTWSELQTTGNNIPNISWMKGGVAQKSRKAGQVVCRWEKNCMMILSMFANSPTLFSPAFGDTESNK